ncbi:MAG: protein translocase subunit [Cirrosporium novae-zelandiae]|nr:MAG: protein translocase subunit [Cirrosporium novae-zelandiae]
MNVSARLVPAQANLLACRRAIASAKSFYGRTTPYRRLQTQSYVPGSQRTQPTRTLLSPTLSSIRLSPAIILRPLWYSLTIRRGFASNPPQYQEARQGGQVKDPPRQKTSAEANSKPTQGPEETKASEQSKDNEKEGEEGEKKEEKKKEEPPPPPPHGDKTPWQVFTDTLKSEFRASKEWNESTKALAEGAHQFTESESVKRARAAATAASEAATSTTAKVLTGTGKAIGHSAAWTWDTSVVRGVRASVNATGRGIELATRPVRQTKAYKKTIGGIKDTMDDGASSRYGGWIEKEERRKQRELRELEEIRAGKRPARPAEENPNAGTNITVHKDAAWRESWREFKDSSKLMQSLFTLKSTYNESENPFILTARGISDRVAGFFAENETAQVIKKFKEMDPSFQLEPFLREMREYILPEVLDAYVKGDTETLKLWLSAAQFQVYSALTHQYHAAGLVSDGRILDIRNVEILTARMLDPGEVPVFIVTCRTQEVHVYRNAKTKELAAGMEDKVQLVTYAIGVTRLPEEITDPETRGWRLIELQKSARDWI